MSIFTENESYRPFKYGWAITEAKRHSIDMFWDVHQIELQDDIRQYNTRGGLATKNFSHERNKATIDTLQLMFTELDRSVADGYIRILPYTKNNEIKTLFLTQAQRETVHQRGYAILAESLGVSDADWKSFNQYREMRDKLDVMRGDEDDLSIPLNYAKFLTRVLLGEGIGLFAAFAVLLNFKRFGLLMGFNDVNQWSLSDETFHVENNIRVVQEMEKVDLGYAEKLELKNFTTNLVRQYVDAEHALIDLLGDQEDLSKESLKDYIEHLGELRLYQRGYIAYDEVRENPVEWMDWLLSATKHDNFFEKRVTSYSHGGLVGEIDYSKYQVLLEEKQA